MVQIASQKKQPPPCELGGCLKISGQTCPIAWYSDGTGNDTPYKLFCSARMLQFTFVSSRALQNILKHCQRQWNGTAVNLREQWNSVNVAKKNYIKHKVFALFSVVHCSLRCSAVPFHCVGQCFNMFCRVRLLTKVNYSILAEQKSLYRVSFPVPPLYQAIGHVCPLILRHPPPKGKGGQDTVIRLALYTPFL